MKKYNNNFKTEYKQVQEVAIINFERVENFHIGIWNYIGAWFPLENGTLVFKTVNNWKLIEKI